MLDETVKAYIDKSVLCWLATTDGACPSLSPKQIFTYYGNDTIIIANIASPQSMKNIKKNSNVCVSFVDVFVQKGFQIYGVAHKCKPSLDTASDSGQEKLAILQKLAGAKLPFASFTNIDITKVKPILAPSYRMRKDITEEEMIEDALKGYGVMRR